MTGYTTEGWGELFIAEAGASAALGGLLFVALSINLERIIALRSLPGAALGAIVLLVAVLMISTFDAGARAAPMGARRRGARGGDRRLVDPDRHLDSSGVAFSLVVAVVNAWVLLVEVVR